MVVADDKGGVPEDLLDDEDEAAGIEADGGREAEAREARWEGQGEVVKVEMGACDTMFHFGRCVCAEAHRL